MFVVFSVLRLSFVLASELMSSFPKYVKIFLITAMKGWECNISGAQTYSDLPIEAQVRLGFVRFRRGALELRAIIGGRDYFSLRVCVSYVDGNYS